MRILKQNGRVSFKRLKRRIRSFRISIVVRRRNVNFYLSPTVVYINFTVRVERYKLGTLPHYRGVTDINNVGWGQHHVPLTLLFVCTARPLYSMEVFSYRDYIKKHNVHVTIDICNIIVCIIQVHV